ncbi:MAG: ProS, partial [Chthonomonadales bacterium]|nr:ProS [Chthonomonadales bacterium]
IYVDNELREVGNYIVGANAADAHTRNVTPGHDFEVTVWGDIRTAVAGDRCPRCADGHLTDARGIEVGHIFKLGTKYSKDMQALYQSESGEKLPVLMGCYGLGVSRTMASAIEANHDAAGIVWPISIAPFTVSIVIANMKEEGQVAAAEKLYQELRAKKVDVLLDERDERTGVKFKDMELIGIPIQVVVGKGLATGVIEIGLRREQGSTRAPVAVDEAAKYVTDLNATEEARLQ